MKCLPRGVQLGFLLATLWSALLIEGAYGAGDPYCERLKSGMHSLQSCQYTQAVHYFDAALDLDQNAPPARDGLGLSLLLSGNLGKARDEFQAALRIDSKDPVALTGMALVCISQGSAQEGSDLLNQIDGPIQPKWREDAIQYLKVLNSEASSTTEDSKSLLVRAAEANLEQANSQILKEFAVEVHSGRFDNRPGMYAMFDSIRPIQAAHHCGISIKSRTVPKASNTWTGIVPLQARVGNQPDVSYVQFLVDGKSVGITNTEPYICEWNTAGVTNGYHQLITQGISQGSEVVYTKRQSIRVWNRFAHPVLWTDPALQPIAEQMLEDMTVYPSSKVIHYWLGKSLLAQGEKEEAAASLEYTMAIDPDYRDTRHLILQAYSPIPSAQPIWFGPKGNKDVILTFDDGPNHGGSDQLLDILKAEEIPATFFVVGMRAEVNQDLVHRMQREGHCIENHTYSHLRLIYLTPIEIERQLFRNIAVVREITGKRMLYMRPPGGRYNLMVADVLQRYGIRPVFWSADCYNMEGGSPDQMVAFALNRIHDGGILLMHNGENTTLHALPRIIRGLQARGFHFITLDQLTIKAASASSHQLNARLNSASPKNPRKK